MHLHKHPHRKTVLGVVTAYHHVYGFGVIRIVAVDDPKNPRVIGSGILTSDFSGVPFKVTIIDQYAYVATLEVGIQIVDIQKAIAPHLPDASVLAGAINTTTQDSVEAWPRDLKSIGHHLIGLTEKISLAGGELITANATDPTSASVIQGRLSLLGGLGPNGRGGRIYLYRSARKSGYQRPCLRLGRIE